MLPIMSAIGSIGSSLLGGLFSANSQSQQEQFQEQMSNTAYTRASADMKNAGLNPAMMFGGGSAASTPAGASASMPAPDISGAITQAISTAKQAQLADANVAKLAQDTNKSIAETANTEADTVNKAKQGGLIDAQAAKTDTDNLLDQAQTAKTKVDTLLSGVNVRRGQALADVDENSALSARNQQDMNPTARKVLDQINFGTAAAGDAAKMGASAVTNVLPGGKVAKGAKAIYDWMVQ